MFDVCVEDLYSDFLAAAFEERVCSDGAVERAYFEEIRVRIAGKVEKSVGFFQGRAQCLQVMVLFPCFDLAGNPRLDNGAEQFRAFVCCKCFKLSELCKIKP